MKEINPLKCKNFGKKCVKCIHFWECQRKMMGINDYYEEGERR